MKHIRPALSLLLAAFAAQAQTVVFDTLSINDPASASLTAQNNNRFADDATLVNPFGETIGQIDFSVGGNYDTTADVYVTLLDATGPGGAPGNTLWSSAAIPSFFALYDDFQDFASVTVPNIAVPQSFFWAVEFRNIVAQNDPFGDPPVFPFFGPYSADNATVLPAGATTSTSIFYVDADGANGPGGFTAGFQSDGSDSTLAVKIYNSVPEPAAASLLALGGAGVALLLRRQRRA